MKGRFLHSGIARNLLFTGIFLIVNGVTSGFYCQTAAAQAGSFSPEDIPGYLVARNEIYFTFLAGSREEIGKLSKQISFDRVDGLRVTAYATVPQYRQLCASGYTTTILPSPGLAEEIRCRDHTILGPLTTWNFYPTYSNYESIMAQFQAMYPGLCDLDTIATLTSGRRLLVLKISDNVGTDEKEPEYFYSSSIHGDETAGYIMMLHLADYLLSNYSTNAEVANLVNNLEIYICPLANPDGTYYGGNSSVTGARRYNANGVDLNRNYPDPQDGPHPDGNAWQPETVAFMNFATQRHFAAGVNFHGGTEVVNYPWDTWATLHADDAWYQFVSRIYADTVHVNAISGYMTYLNNGITNGYAWYMVNGGRQDYMNFYHHCRESTIELSYVKLIPESQIIPHWNYNWRSLILMLKHTLYGVHGTVKDLVTGLPLEAKVNISGHDNNGSEVYSDASVGDYHRLLKAGTYTLEFSAPCYVTQVIPNVTVTDYSSYNLDIQLVPGAGVTTTTPAAITGNTATSGGTITCAGSSAITARGVCWNPTANPDISGSHTNDGGGTGSFTSQISGLSPSTLYHVRAYATNAQGTVYGSDLTFRTTCGTISAFPWMEGFENSGTIPSCWTQQQVSSSGVNWKFIVGNGGSNPSGAHSGIYNACLKDYSSGDNKTRLITPPLNLAQLPLPQLKFWHTQEDWGGDQDKLSVYYRTSSTSSWILLVAYTTSIPDWTPEIIPLPNPSADYSICFEGNARFGYGVCLDDVEISTGCAAMPPSGVTISASANPVLYGNPVTFICVPVNAGSTPSCQWRVNGADVPGATTITYTYTPADNDQVSCRIVSSDPCSTGSPAISNVITMMVTTIPENLYLGNDSVFTGQTECFRALQDIIVAGEATPFLVESGGQASFLAGHSIRFQSGTKVQPGGMLHGWISDSLDDCGPSYRSAGDLHASSGKPAEPGSPSKWILYPNPTPGMLTIEPVNKEISRIPVVELFDARGQRLMHGHHSPGSKIVLHLQSLPDGIYLVRISGIDLPQLYRVIKIR